MQDPLRLVNDPDVPDRIAADVREAIDLGVAGPDVPLDSVMDRLDTTISILTDDEAFEASPPAAEAGSSRRWLLVLVLVTLAAAVAIAVGTL